MTADTEAYIGPQRARAFPNDIELELYFPRQIETTDQKVIYTLWREGAQSYSNLYLLTGLSKADLDQALKQLEKERRIVATPFKGTRESQSQWAHTIFSLVTK